MVEVKYNTAFNGIEIYFDEKPEEDTLQVLRNAGWRWHRSKGCWYNRDTEDNRELANILVDEEFEYDEFDVFNLSEGIPAFEEPTTISYNIEIGNRVVADVTITKANGQFTVSSSNNQMVCSDCNRMYSIHAAMCPGCGCPASYTIEEAFNTMLKQQVAENERQFKEERATASALERQRQIEQRQQEREREQVKKENLVFEIRRDSGYCMGNNVAIETETVEKLEQIHRDILLRRKLIASIPKSAKTFFVNKGVKPEFISTQTLKVVKKRCSDYLKRRDSQGGSIDAQAEAEFRKVVLNRIDCDEQSLVRVRDLYTKYACEYSGNKSEYDIIVTASDGTKSQIDVTFFGGLRSYFKQVAAKAFGQAYKAWLKPLSYMGFDGQLIDPAKGRIFVIYSKLAYMRVHPQYAKEIAENEEQLMSVEEASEILGDLDVNRSLLYRVVVVSQDDTIVESKDLTHNHPTENVFLRVSIYDDIKQLEERLIVGIYCRSCNRYYISDDEFLELVMSGRVNARMLTAELSEYSYDANDAFKALSPESLLKKCGYTVNSNDNLTDGQRQRIIKSVVENRLYLPGGIISHLSFLISMGEKVETRDMSDAIKKWKRDIDFINMHYSVVD